MHLPCMQLELRQTIFRSLFAGACLLLLATEATGGAGQQGGEGGAALPIPVCVAGWLWGVGVGWGGVGGGDVNPSPRLSFLATFFFIRSWRRTPSWSDAIEEDRPFFQRSAR